jgi:hypothetical protein
MTLSCAEYGRIGGLKLQASRSPEQRKESSRHAYLAGAVKAVVERAPDLSPEQLTRLRALFSQEAMAVEKR